MVSSIAKDPKDRKDIVTYREIKDRRHADELGRGKLCVMQVSSDAERV